jgi:hypothetical protein
MLKSLILAATLALPLAAFAVDDKKPSGQQQRMATCNKEAKQKELKGDERKKFMSACLSGAKSEAAAANMTQQQKMGSCNREAGARKLEGEARKKFVSECLRG